MAYLTESNQDSSATVLLVEDDRPLLEFFSRVLPRDGYGVLEADNGVEAMQVSEEHSDDLIDVLLSDVQSPYLVWIEFSGRLR